MAAQQPFTTQESNVLLLGRFLHITDMHLDRNYREHSAVVSQCHREKPKHRHGGERRSGHWGTQQSDCDSPYALANLTMSWLADAWAVEDHKPFDFVLWTGDTGRHDQDIELPRQVNEITDMNQAAIDLFDTYLPGVPIVPNFGNNDIVLHNTMPGGPTDELQWFSRIWKKHIPEDQMQVFLRGGYFAKDLIPNKLGVISLNTLYFYDSNKAVEGCTRRSRWTSRDEVDPGTLQLEWLVERLVDFRRRNMQVHLIGHVPPTSGNYFPRCYDVYTELVLRFQDTILAQHFGHMNFDTFFVQESSLANGGNKPSRDSVPILHKQIEQDLRYDFESLPGNARTEMEYYGVFFEAPSVVPMYRPSVRVWTYNTTLDFRAAVAESDADLAALLDYVGFDSCDESDRSQECEWVGEDEEVEVLKRQGRRHRRPKRKHRRSHARLPRYASSLSPSRSNTFLSLLGYSQWVLPLNEVNEAYDHVYETQGLSAASMLRPNYTLEYTTYDAPTLWHPYVDLSIQSSFPPPRHHELPSQHHVPVPKTILDGILQQNRLSSPFQCQKSVCKMAQPLKIFTTYGLPDMTLRPMLDLARRLVLDKKMWKTYVNRMYTSVD